MKAFVIGAGRVGALVASRLNELVFDVTVIDKDPNALTNPILEGVSENFGTPLGDSSRTHLIMWSTVDHGRVTQMP